MTIGLDLKETHIAAGVGRRTINTHPTGWIQTYSGHVFWPLDPQPGDVRIIDIAHSLSLKCRYSGHCEDFYSVAQHSVLVSDLVTEAAWQKHNRAPTLMEQQCALLHDAAEAYLADLPRPIKPVMPGFDEIEERVERAIATRFDVQYPWPDVVKLADNLVYGSEKPRLMKATLPWGALGEIPKYVELVPLPWQEAKRLFLNRFSDLFPGVPVYL